MLGWMEVWPEVTTELLVRCGPKEVVEVVRREVLAMVVAMQPPPGPWLARQPELLHLLHDRTASADLRCAVCSVYA